MEKVYLSVDHDGQEKMFSMPPEVDTQLGKYLTPSSMRILLPDGTIEKLLGRKLNYDDGSVEFPENKPTLNYFMIGSHCITDTGAVSMNTNFITTDKPCVNFDEYNTRQEEKFNYKASMITNIIRLTEAEYNALNRKG